jgi:hypothetical protein
MELSKKAYIVDFSKIDDPYAYSDFDHIAHGETKGKAKAELFKEGQYMELRSEEEMTFITFPVIRCRDFDLFLYEGEEMTKGKIDDLLKEAGRKEHLNALLNDKKVTHCYIVKRRLYYRYNCAGYTAKKEEAGVYPKEQAVSEAKGCEEISLEVIYTPDHNKMIDDKISLLNSYKINPQKT